MFWAITAACRPFFTLRLSAGGRLWGFLAIPCILPDAPSWSVYLYLFFPIHFGHLHLVCEHCGFSAPRTAQVTSLMPGRSLFVHLLFKGVEKKLLPPPRGVPTKGSGSRDGAAFLSLPPASPS